MVAFFRFFPRFELGDMAAACAFASSISPKFIGINNRDVADVPQPGQFSSCVLGRTGVHR
jgi:hypothetical protein